MRLFLRLLVETGLPFYMVIRTTRRSSRLQGYGHTTISQLFSNPEYWSGGGGGMPVDDFVTASLIPQGER